VNKKGGTKGGQFGKYYEQLLWDIGLLFIAIILTQKTKIKLRILTPFRLRKKNSKL